MLCKKQAEATLVIRNKEILWREVIFCLVCSFGSPCPNMDFRIAFILEIPKQEHVSVVGVLSAVVLLTVPFLA